MELNESRPRSPRPSRQGQFGMTLTELLVSMAILAAISGSIAGAFAIGFKVLSPTGAQATLVGNHDLLAFEQQIGADVARADCLASIGPPVQTSIPTTGCTNSVMRPIRSGGSTCGSSYFLCLAWYVPGAYVPGAPPATCHTVTYSAQAATQVVDRSDFNSSTGVTKTARIATGGLSVQATWGPPIATSNNGYGWTNKVKVVVTQQAIAGAKAAAKPPQTTFYLVPLAADPLSPVLPAGASPC
jgi:prepilin-type N-terminal cleavage/methylation domain-containing protein